MSVYILRLYTGPSASEFREIASLDLQPEAAGDMNIKFQASGLPFRVFGETPRQAEIRKLAGEREFEETERIRKVVKIVLAEISAEASLQHQTGTVGSQR